MESVNWFGRRGRGAPGGAIPAPIPPCARRALASRTGDCAAARVAPLTRRPAQLQRW